MTDAHRGWHGRGYLPHFDDPGRVQHIIFRLHGSLPQSVLDRLGDAVVESSQRRAEVDAALDRGEGPRWLARPEVADLATAALKHFDSQRYKLLSWCVMPNHMHVLAYMMDGWPLDRVVKSWKAYSGRYANVRLGRSGPFWAPDYFDRYMRSEGEVLAAVEYIEANPVKAGLCLSPDVWPWSSATGTSTDLQVRP